LQLVRVIIAVMVRRTMACTEVDIAQKVTIALEDDLDGGPADETVRFGFGGAVYEIDLSSKNAGSFRARLAPSTEHARKAGRGPARPGRPDGGRPVARR
jgi:hypothetical protein